MSLADVKNHLSEVVERVSSASTDASLSPKHGRPAAVVMSVEDLDSLNTSR